MRDAILIIGAGIFQEPAIRIAKEMGLEVIATDIRQDAPGLKHADHVEMVSKFDIERTIAIAESYTQTVNLRGVMTIGTDVSYTVACVASALGLPGIDPESALMATNKALMRRRLKTCGVPVPEFRTSSIREEAIELACEVGFPLVIKPVDNMGARGIRRLDNLMDLLEWFPVAQGNSRSGEVILEEYMTGPEVSIDTLVYDNEVYLLTIADRHIGRLPYFVELGHTLPSTLPEEEQQDVFDVLKKGIRALGITLGASKGDIKVTPEGARIGEMTARMSGGFHCQYTDPLATGMNSIRAAIHLAIGNPLPIADITPKWDKTAVERAILAEPGVVMDITGVDEALEIDGVKHVFLNVSEGDLIEPLCSNIGKPGHVITVGDTHDEAVYAVQQALDTIKIHTSKPAELEPATVHNIL